MSELLMGQCGVVGKAPDWARQHVLEPFPLRRVKLRTHAHSFSSPCCIRGGSVSFSTDALFMPELSFKLVVFLVSYMRAAFSYCSNLRVIFGGLLFSCQILTPFIPIFNHKNKLILNFESFNSDNVCSARGSGSAACHSQRLFALRVVWSLSSHWL